MRMPACSPSSLSRVFALLSSECASRCSASSLFKARMYRASHRTDAGSSWSSHLDSAAIRSVTSPSLSSAASSSAVSAPSDAGPSRLAFGRTPASVGCRQQHGGWACARVSCVCVGVGACACHVCVCACVCGVCVCVRACVSGVCVCACRPEPASDGQVGAPRSSPTPRCPRRPSAASPHAHARASSTAHRARAAPARARSLRGAHRRMQPQTAGLRPPLGRARRWAHSAEAAHAAGCHELSAKASIR